MTYKWIIGFIVILLWTGLAVFSGYHLKKDKVCPETRIDTIYVTKTDTIKKTFTKIVKAKPDTIFVGDSLTSQFVISNELVDTTIVFDKDSLDFVADISYNPEIKSFHNDFDFNLRIFQRVKEIVKEILVPMKPEIYQEPLVICLIAAVMLSLGLAL